MKKTRKNLSLSKETLHGLDNLEGVAGGATAHLYQLALHPDLHDQPQHLHDVPLLKPDC